MLQIKEPKSILLRILMNKLLAKRSKKREIMLNSFPIMESFSMPGETE